MLYLTIFLTLLFSAKSENKADVNYSFDSEFFNHFDSKKCDGKSAWRLVRYETLDIKSQYPGSDQGIQALRQSCTSSFPIVFHAGTLEINVFIRVSSKKSGITVEVLDEYDTPVSRLVYGPSKKGFRFGWRKIFLQIDKEIKGYVQFRGRSLKNETVIVDSFKYKSHITYTQNHTKAKRSINYETEIENIHDTKQTNDQEEITKYEDTIESYDISAGVEKFESSEVSDLDAVLDNRTDSPNESNNEQQKTISFWVVVTIFIATFTLIALITGASAYYCGKLRAPDPSPILSEDFEPPRTITIPRVTCASENTSRLTRIF